MARPNRTPRQTALVPNRPTLEGRLLGQELARLTDVAEQETRQRFPRHRGRCQSCAFTQGTVPNGCPETVMDALKAVIDRIPFYCHQAFNADGSPQDLCAGWAMAQVSLQAERLRGDMILAPWKFSNDEG